MQGRGLGTRRNSFRTVNESTVYVSRVFETSCNVVSFCVCGVLSEVIRGVLNRPGELLVMPDTS